MKHRVIYIIDGMNMGGAERLLLQIVINLNPGIFSPRICILQQRGNNNLTEQFYQRGIEVDILNIKRIIDFQAIPKIVRYLRKNKPDIVHTQLQLSDILGNVSSSFMQTPSVCTIHTLMSQGTTIKNRIKQNLEWFIHRHCCQKIITVSEASRRNYLEFNAHCKPSNVVTICNGIDLSPFSIKTEDQQNHIKQLLGIPTHKRIVTTVAVLRKEKGIQYALEALPNILSKEPELIYLIVGNGSYRQTLEKIVAEKNLHNNVLFTGQRDDIAQLLSISDIFLLPSLTEALPTVIAEAMATAVPIIATRVGGIPEMISDNHNGLLISPRNTQQIVAACLFLLSDREKAKEIGRAGFETVQKKFNIIQQVQELEQLYLEIIQSKSRAK